jgi:hypothetical protein
VTLEQSRRHIMMEIEVWALCVAGLIVLALSLLGW